MNENGLKKALFIIFAVLLLAVVILFALNFAGTKSFEVSADNHEQLTEAEMLGTFQTDYGWTYLEAQELFWDEEAKQVVINYYFAKDADEWQIDSAGYLWRY